jgi:membrane dipeptidase
VTRPAPAWRTQRPYLAEAIVCDGLLPWTEIYLPPGADLPTQLRRFWHNGVDHISLTAAAGRDGPLDALKRLGHLRNTIGAHDWIREASTPDAIRAARTSGQLSVSYHFQSATPFIPPYGAPDLDLVDAFKGAGIIRSILAYNEANVFADGCHEPRDAGLSTYGHRLIQRMDSAGMVIDLSHCGIRTTFDALNAALRRPPIFSHANARALHDHERNITDAQIKACGDAGGYVGINGVGMFLGAAGPDIPQRIAEHAAHVAGLIGPGRVGLGLDFMFLEGSDYSFFHSVRDRFPRGYPDPPWDFLQPEQFGDLVEALERQGFSQNDLPGILGENYLRLAT